MATSLEVQSPLSDGMSQSSLLTSQSTSGLADPISIAPRASAIADRSSAIIWRNAASDQTAGWGIQGTTFQSGALFQNMPAIGGNSNWKLIDAGEFGGANTLLWRNAVTDQTAVWTVEGTTFSNGYLLTGAPTLGSNSPWTLIGGVTLNEAPTLVWRNQSTDQTAVWTFDNEGVFQSGSLLANTPSVGRNSPWQIVDAVANGNTLELLWRNQAADQTGIWTFNGTEFASGALLDQAPQLGSNSPWQFNKFVDVDGNGSSDIILKNRTTGQQAIWFLNGTTLESGSLLENAPRPDANWQIVGFVSADSETLSITPPPPLDPGAPEDPGEPIESELTAEIKAGITAVDLPVTNTLIWSNPQLGQTANWGVNLGEANQTTFVSGSLLGQAPTVPANSPWQLIDTIDKGNGTAQYLWRNAVTDETAFWNIENNTFVSATLLSGAPTLGSNSPWKLIAGVTLNEAPTLLWRNQATDETAIWTFSNEGAFQSGSLLTNAPSVGRNSPWQIVDAVGNGGELKLLWRNQAADQTGIWTFNGTEYESGAALGQAPQLGSNSPWQFSEFVDVDGNGSADIVLKNRITGQQALWFLDGNTLQSGKLIENAPSPDANWQIVGLIPANPSDLPIVPPSETPEEPGTPEEEIPAEELA